MKRRKFIRIVAGGSFVFLTPLQSVAAETRITLPLDKLKKLHEVGGSMTLKIKGKKLLLVRHADDAINAVSPVCTHKQCDVRYVRDKTRFGCKCHKSEFDLTGKNINGPAPKPLTTYATQFDGKKAPSP